MKNILKKMALLAIPVVLWFVFFAAFEPNNYFGLKASASSSQPVARVRAYQQAPGTNLILGDSRLAHFDMQLVNSLTGQPWQNLAFGGASLKETLDLADYILNSGHEVDTLLAEVSFYTLNAGYNTDRFAALEETLNNPLAYCFNLEYNVNALTVAMDTLRGTPDTIESGDWTESDYLAACTTTPPPSPPAAGTGRSTPSSLSGCALWLSAARPRACGSSWFCRRWRKMCAPRSAMPSASAMRWRMRYCPRCAPGPTATALPCWTMSGAAAASQTMTRSFLTVSTLMKNTACRFGHKNCLTILQVDM